MFIWSVVLRKSSKSKGPRPSETPLPGRPVKGSDSGRPIMAALHLFSRRWVLRIIWELREGPLGFRQLRAQCDQMSPDTLSTRLSELKEAGIVARDEEADWILTPLGEELGPAMLALSRWSEKWAEALGEGAVGAD